MDLGLAGKRAVVAAASTGLGFHAAAALAAAGAQVTICGRGARVADAAREIGATAFTVDLADPAAAAGFVRDSHAHMGGLDILIANAGGPRDGRFDEIDTDRMMESLHLNLLSTIAMCREAIPYMREQRWGRVVAITSSAVRRPNPNAVMTGVSRAGATAYLKSLSLEVAADGITVNSVAPGFHDTERLTSVHGDKVPLLVSRVPAGRLGRPEDFGQIVAFLCSEQANFISGVSLPVDGAANTGIF